jgi:HK97 gp10 family phage protein
MFTGTFTGWPETERLLDTILNEATKKDLIADAMMRAAEPIVDTAQQLARRKSGKMAESIAVKRVEDEEAAKQVVVKVGADTRRPHWQLFHLHELGTSRKAAKPMVRPAWDENRPTFSGRVGSEIEPAFARAAARHARGRR